jgi:hypothetical protein
MEYDSTPKFDAQFLKLISKNKALEMRLLKKISQILDNPSIGTPKHRAIQGWQGGNIRK